MQVEIIKNYLNVIRFNSAFDWYGSYYFYQPLVKSGEWKFKVYVNFVLIFDQDYYQMDLLGYLIDNSTDDSIDGLSDDEILGQFDAIFVYYQMDSDYGLLSKKDFVIPEAQKIN